MPELKKINTDVFINLRDRTENIIISANRGDTNSRTIRFNFIYEDEIYEIPEGTIARFMGTRPDGYAILEEEPCTINGNQVLYEMTPYVLNIPGDVKAKIELRNTRTDQILTTVSFIIHIPKDPFDENAIIYTDEFSLLNTLIKKVEEALDNVADALEEIDQAIDDTNDAIDRINETNDRMKETIENAKNVIGDMNEKLEEVDEKVAIWQKDIDDMLFMVENATNTANQATEAANSATEKSILATSNAITATEQTNKATEQANKAAERAIAAAKAAEAAFPFTIPATGKPGQILRYQTDGVAVWENETNPIIIQETTPPGDKAKLWINPTTRILCYYSGTAWVKIAAVWT